MEQLKRSEIEDYKEAKRLFRKEQRRCIQEYELKEYEGMEKAAEQNHDAFWIMVNSRKRRRKELTIPKVGEETLDDVE